MKAFIKFVMLYLVVAVPVEAYQGLCTAYRHPPFRTSWTSRPQSKRLSPALFFPSQALLKEKIRIGNPCIDVEKLPQEVHDRYLRNLRDYNEAIADIAEKAEEQGRTKERVEIARGLLGEGMVPARDETFSRRSW